jgi:hypothetical protein
MSSPKPAAKAGRGKVKAPSATRRKAPSAPVRKVKAADSAASSQALHLAEDMERGLIDGRLDVVSDEALQKLIAAVCKTYSQQVQAEVQAPALNARSGVSATDVMITASALLKAVDLQVFELGMWQSWTGR